MGSNSNPLTREKYVKVKSILQTNLQREMATNQFIKAARTQKAIEKLERDWRDTKRKERLKYGSETAN